MAITRRHAIAAPLAALALGACGRRGDSADPNAPRILLRGNGPDPDSLDPHRARSTESMQVLRDLFEGLTRLDHAAAPHRLHQGDRSRRR
jgi:ABC-type oligopeptide transport system substrate-binding subunit